MHLVLYMILALRRHRKFLQSSGKPVAHHKLVSQSLDAIWLPNQIAVCKCEAHTNNSDRSRLTGTAAVRYLCREDTPTKMQGKDTSLKMFFQITLQNFANVVLFVPPIMWVEAFTHNRPPTHHLTNHLIWLWNIWLFSTWVEVFPTANQDSGTVADTFSQVENTREKSAVTMVLPLLVLPSWVFGNWYKHHSTYYPAGAVEREWSCGMLWRNRTNLGKSAASCVNVHESKSKIPRWFWAPLKFCLADHWTLRN